MAPHILRSLSLVIGRHRPEKNPFLTLDTHTHTHAQESFISNGHMGALCAYLYDGKYFKFSHTYFVFRVSSTQTDISSEFPFNLPPIFHRRWRCSAIDQQKFNPIAVSQVLHHKCALTQALALIRYWPSVNH